ncbi:MAG: hypothetical protein NTV70_17830 [Acidobacteria bacterium]|nr:hypothetical protein [Acidobacteriota bacterium]
MEEFLNFDDVLENHREWSTRMQTYFKNPDYSIDTRTILNGKAFPIWKWFRDNGHLFINLPQYATLVESQTRFRTALADAVVKANSLVVRNPEYVIGAQSEFGRALSSFERDLKEFQSRTKWMTGAAV